MPYADPLKTKYVAVKWCAYERGIAWRLTFESWLQIWEESGHLHERGVHKGQYVMARFGDKGPYSVSNVKICTVEENGSEKVLSKEVRARIGKAQRGNRHRRGTKHSAAALRKMRKAKLGNKYALGNRHSAATRAKIRAATLRQFATKGHPRLGLRAS